MVNDSVFVFVGEPVRVGEDIRVTMDCSRLIDDVINNGTQNTTVTWYDHIGTPIDGRYVASGAVISADGRQCIIPVTSIIPQYGIDGDYTCEVCSDANACITRSTTLFVCGE